MTKLNLKQNSLRAGIAGLLVMTLLACGKKTDSVTETAIFRGDLQRSGFWHNTGPLHLATPVWTFTADGDGAAASPMVYNNIVYSGHYDGTLHALAFENGEPLWAFNSDGGIFSTPLITDTQIIFGSDDGFVYALNHLGELQWRFQTQDKVFASPLKHGEQIYIGSLDGYLYAIDADTGSMQWRFKTGAAVDSSVAMAGDKLLFGSDDGMVYALDQQGQLIW